MLAAQASAPARESLEQEPALEIEVRSQSQVKVIKLRGRLVLGESLERTSATLNDLLNAGETRFLLDLQDVPTLDSSGIGLLVPRYAFHAARLLAIVMVGAVIAHLTVLGGSPVPALALLVLSGIIAYLRKP